jgi:hypothetical protein
VSLPFLGSSIREAAVTESGNESVGKASSEDASADRRSSLGAGQVSGRSIDAAAPRSGADEADVFSAAEREKPRDRLLLGWPSFAEAELRFENEGKDAAWSESIQVRLLTLISQLDSLTLHSLEADCRVSMCRLALLFPDGVEPVYSLRQIYERAGDLELGPVSAETEIEAGKLRRMGVLLRRRVPAASPLELEGR